MLLGAGFPQEIDVRDMGIRGARLRGRRWVNPDGVRVWREGEGCIWRQNGVWDIRAHGAPRLRRPDHFAKVAGRQVDFANDYLRPFLKRYVQEMRTVDPGAIIFLEGVPGQGRPRWGPQDAPNIVHAAHWYDGLTLFTKNLVRLLAVDFGTGKVVFTPRGAWRSFIKQLARMKAETAENMGGIPTLIGEFGIPFDMRDKQAYRTGDFSLQVEAMDASFRAMEANVLSCTLWNYTSDNSNLHGDQWNDEDFSIFSRDQQADPNDIHSGGRALQAVVRPYARAVAGEPLRMAFHYERRTFEFAFRHGPAIRAPTEIFLPNYHYPDGCVAEVSDGTYEVDRASQTLAYWHSMERAVHHIKVKPQ
jgi:hypothetical protein